MKSILLTVMAMMMMSCNPIDNGREVLKNSEVLSTTIDIKITGLISKGVETRSVNVVTADMTNFIEKSDWLNEFEVQNGYAAYCHEFYIERKPGGLCDIVFVGTPIDFEKIDYDEKRLEFRDIKINDNDWYEVENCLENNTNYATKIFVSIRR
jgi:hypothetical protein